MATRILIPTPLRQFTGGSDTLEIEGTTVGDLLKGLVSQHADLKRHLYSDEGKLRSFVNIYLNEDDIRHLQKEETPVSPGDTLSIVPSVAGGSTTLEQGAPELSREEIQRYSRHLIMPEVGMNGQRKLKAARVLCVGAGGLGSPASMYLAAAGIGTLGLVDFDVVDASNLHRQVIYGVSDIGRRKLEAARERLQDMNPDLNVVLNETALTSKNALDVMRGYDVVVDGTDNFQTRYLVNDACVLLGIPNVYGSIFRFDGQASVFAMKDGPCYRCLYPEPPPPGLVPSCAEGGVLGVLPGIIGVIQATEAIKLVLGSGQPLVGRLLLYDALSMQFRQLKLRRDPECPVCGDNPTVRALIDYDAFCGVVPARVDSAMQIPEISVEQLKAKIDSGEAVNILDVREPNEFQICRIEGSTLIPLGQLGARVSELDPNQELIVHCKMGGRSARAVALLRERGFDKAYNLAGGILAWIDRVDPSQSKY
jgi:molybdopterin/thiamine biosynthesis adenylyltransferase/rhodanese-related sulfurtransferase/molybdopterin converting factor small subunit